MWLTTNPKVFWHSFSDHTDKLHSVQTLAVLNSGEPIHSAEAFNERVRTGSRFAHKRKLRGLYVDYVGGQVQHPSDITEQEAWQAINITQRTLDRDSASWDKRVSQAKRWSERPEFARAIWVIFMFWSAKHEPDLVLSVIRDGWSSIDFQGLLHRFEQHVKSVGWETFIADL
jgi:AbiV family abortive infection protein